jgi:hypothetical protein
MPQLQLQSPSPPKLRVLPLLQMALRHLLLSPDYINAQSHYWSAANADLIPACAVFSPNVQDVSGIVTVY